MNRKTNAFTAVFMQCGDGYFGFITELAGVNAHGRTLDETRNNLRDIARIAIEEERRHVEALIAGKNVVREAFSLSVASG